MKKIAITLALLAGVTSSVLSQGTVYVDLIANNPAASSTATTDGLIYVKTGAAAPVLLTTDASFALFAGTSSSSLTLITTGSGTGEVGDYDAPGQFTDNSGTAYNLGVPGGSTAWIELEVWKGTTYSSYGAAVTAADPAGFAIFQNPTGTLGSVSPAPTLTGMPSMVLTVPEPSTMVLGGLGAAALLLFRRRK
jgi:hypothetical protein